MDPLLNGHDPARGGVWLGAAFRRGKIGPVLDGVLLRSGDEEQVRRGKRGVPGQGGDEVLGGSGARSGIKELSVTRTIGKTLRGGARGGEGAGAVADEQARR
jgi:hypothetical protein